MGVKIEAEDLKPRYPNWKCDKCNIPNSLAMKYFRERAPKNVDLQRESRITVYCSPKKVTEGYVRIMLRVERQFAVKGNDILENEIEADNFSIDITNRCRTKVKTIPPEKYFPSLMKL